VILPQQTSEPRSSAGVLGIVVLHRNLLLRSCDHIRSFFGWMRGTYSSCVLFRSYHHLVYGDKKYANYRTREEDVAGSPAQLYLLLLDRCKAVERQSLPAKLFRTSTIQHKRQSLAGTLLTMPSSPTITWKWVRLLVILHLSSMAGYTCLIASSSLEIFQHDRD
jgi:hypothetical protein